MGKNMLHKQSDRKTIYTERPPFPKNMMMEVTNACNHKCLFCGNRNQKRRRVQAEKELYFRLIDEAGRLGVKEIGFYMSGEPLLCNELEEYIDRAKNTDGGVLNMFTLLRMGVLQI